MLIIPDHFILTATPRTGSRALIDAFKRSIMSEKTDYHHQHPEDVQSLATASGLPIVSICRSPYRQLRSLYAHAILRTTPKGSTPDTFEDFLRDFNLSFFYDGRLNPYHAISDAIYLFDEKDLRSTADRIAQDFLDPERALMVKHNLVQVGGTFGKPNVLNEETRSFIRDRYPDDYALYRSCVEQGGVLKGSRCT